MEIRLTLYAAKVTWLLESNFERRRLPRVWSSLLKVKIEVLGMPSRISLGFLLRLRDTHGYQVSFPLSSHQAPR